MGTGKTYSTKYLLDSNNSSGVAGQVLSTTSTGIDWVDANTVPGTGLWLANGNDIYNSNSGNVGIGITGPTAKLHLFTSGAEAINLGIQNSERYYKIETDGGFLTFNDVSAGGTARMVIDSSGNVGIGVTGPATKLEVSSSLTSGIKVTNSGTINGEAGIEAYHTGAQTGTAYAGYITKTGAGGTNVGIYTAASGATNNYGLIVGSGNVGIGTTSPQQLLHISNTSGGFGAEAVLRGSTSTGIPKSEIAFKRFTSGDGAEIVLRTSNSGGTLQHVMTLATSGNVGIGVANPETSRLLVRGSTNDSTSQIFQAANLAGNTRYAIRPDGDNKWYKNDSSLSMILTSTGNVGIGVTAPIVPLHVSGAAVNDPSNGTGGYEVMQIFDTTSYATGVGGGIGFGGNFTSNNNTIFSEIRGIKENATDNNYAGALTLSTRANGANITERMRITSGGTIGINKINPGEVYQVDIKKDMTDPDTSGYGMRIDTNISGTKSAATDIAQGGLFLDTDSSAIGTTTDEHRVVGINNDVRYSGLPDAVYATQSRVESNSTQTGQTTTVSSAYNIAQSDGGANHTVSNLSGTYNLVQLQDNSAVPTTYGTRSLVQATANKASNAGIMYGSYVELDLDSTNNINYGGLHGYRAVIDNNQALASELSSTYLFRGQYNGVRTDGDCWGLYVGGNKHYLEGNVGINETNPGVKLQLISADEQLTNFSSSVADQLAYSQINANSSTSGTITAAAALELVGKANGSGHGRHVWIGAEGTPNTNTKTKLKFKIRGETASGYDWAGAAEAPTIMTLEGDGNVGIGETTPNCKLDVKGVVNTTIIAATTLGDGGGAANRGLVIRTLTDGGEITTVGSSTNMYLNTANNLYLQNASNTKATMLANGNVGIGTTNPTSKLVVGDLANTSGALNDIFVTGDKVNFDGYYARLIFGNSSQSGSSTASIRGERKTDNYGTELTFYTNTNGSPGNGTERMRIGDSGAIKFNAYGAGTLVSDASGNITVSSGGGAGGPFLPLAGNTVATAMSGDINIGDNLGINWLSATNAFADITLGTDFRIYVGKSNADLIIENASNDLILKAAGDILIDDYIVHNGDTNSYFGFGAADEYKIILDNSTKIAADASSAYLYFEGLQVLKTYGDSNTTSGVTVPLGRLYSFDTDTDTGMFSDLANHIAFLAGNNNILRLESTTSTFSSGGGANGDCTVVIAADTDNTNENSNPILQLKQDAGGAFGHFGLNGDPNNTFSGATVNSAYLRASTDLQFVAGSTVLAATILANGRFGIGTTTATEVLEVQGAAANISISNTSENDSGLIFKDAQDPTGQAAAIKFGSGDNKLKFYVNDDAAQRMVIDTAGNVGINKTSPAVKLDVSDSIAGSGFTDGLARFENTIETSSGGAGVLNVANNYQGGFGTLIKFWFEESSVATINFNSSTNAVVYNTTSDYRLKEDLKSFNGLEIIDQIKTYNYKWKKADARGYGALAHELQEVFPDAVTGEKDGEDMQGVDYSTLVPVLIKSIQELKAEIELLKQK